MSNQLIEASAEFLSRDTFNKGDHITEIRKRASSLEAEDSVTAKVAGHRLTLHHDASDDSKSTYTLHTSTGPRRVAIGDKHRNEDDEIDGEKVNKAFGLQSGHKLGHKVADSMNGIGAGIPKFSESADYLKLLSLSDFNELSEEEQEVYLFAVEQLQEISKKTLGSYISKASYNLGGNMVTRDRQLRKNKKELEDSGGPIETFKQQFPKLARAERKADNRQTGIDRAVKRLTK